MTNPLIISRDQALLDELARLCAAAGVSPDIVGDPAAALGGWGNASLVLVGVDLAAEVAAIEPGRRAGVHLIGWGRLPDEVFRVALTLGVENVAELPRSDSWVLEVLAESGERLDLDAVTIGVVGGSGGAGATTFACALAEIAAHRTPTCLLDLDPLGPGVDTVLGMERSEGVRWDALQQSTGRLGARAFRESLPRRNDLGVLTWGSGATTADAQPFAVRAALSAAVRGHGVVVLDLPRTGDLAEEVMARCQHLVVVTRATVPGLASAARFVERALTSGPLAQVVRGTGIGAAEAARVVGAPVITVMGDQRGLDEAIDLGQGPIKSRRSVLAKAAESVLADCVPEVARDAHADTAA
ncbi:septum site-determining protein Ssd [Nocardioides sp. AE5]|uniref:septum site-determining protein Ssd n=1 Tax=Nocardioides sp. AE5 TaxID=2962573 RepID=UPI0028813C6C|nr:septum site-determining protein Ssd [Nocardioides sp. AE5]MDT0200552.1 septum site determining protein [Nocardioides sp. AE5]